MQIENITKKNYRRVDPEPRSVGDETVLQTLAINLSSLSVAEWEKNLRSLESRYLKHHAYSTANFVEPPPKLVVPKEHKLSTLNQWIEVSIVNGETVTTYQPSNKTLLEKLAKSTPDLVYRRLFFRCGIPKEYDFIKPNENLRQNGGTFTQRLTPEDFRATVAKEIHGHLVDGSDPRPRPKSLGLCNCPSCTAQTKRLEAAGTPFL